MDFFPSASSEAGSQGYLTQNCNFRVNLEGSNVKIFKKEKKEEGIFTRYFSKKIGRKEMTKENTNYNILVAEFKNIIQFFSSNDEAGNDKGNHILIHVSGNKFVSVGDSVFSFEIYEDIILDLYSPSGDEFKFPYAIGERNTYFLNLLENRYVTSVSNVYLKEVGFLNQDGKSFNWGTNGENFPNMYHWGFNAGRNPEKIPIKMIQNYN
tara:strand:+ start:62 stop:688 length:627 start_codon:yes stop_codon:yes gene_type:complete